MFTERDFEDLTVFLDYASDYIDEYILDYNEEQALYERLDEIESILHEYINTEPNKEESPD